MYDFIHTVTTEMVNYSRLLRLVGDGRIEKKNVVADFVVVSSHGPYFMDLRLTVERVSANFFLFIGVPFLSIERRICRRGLTMSKDEQTPGDLIAYHRVS